MWKRVAIYGVALALGTLALQAVDHLRIVRALPGEGWVALVALLFLGLGTWFGVRVSVRRTPPFDGSPAVVEQLGLSARELEVLREIAAGHANKEIARRLEVSPNTVKTHVANLYAKLGAKRRTDALRRARELGILP